MRHARTAASAATNTAAGSRNHDCAIAMKRGASFPACQFILRACYEPKQGARSPGTGPNARRCAAGTGAHPVRRVAPCAASLPARTCPLLRFITGSRNKVMYQRNAMPANTLTFPGRTGPSICAEARGRLNQTQSASSHRSYRKFFEACLCPRPIAVRHCVAP